MGDTGESHTGNETVSELRDLDDSFTHDSDNNKDTMPLLRVAVDHDDDGESADDQPGHQSAAPHLRVALNNDDDEGEENLSVEEHEEEYEGEHEGEEDDEEENGGAENPMEEPVVDDAENVRIVAHVTDGMADSDTGEHLAFPEEHYDEESEEEHEQGHGIDHGESQGEDHGETREEDHADYEDEREENHRYNGENGEQRAVVHVQGYDKYHEGQHDDGREEEQQQEVQGEDDHEEERQEQEVQHEGGEIGLQKGDHTEESHFEDDQETSVQLRKEDELQALINLADEETEDDADLSMNGGGEHAEVSEPEQPAIADVKVNGDQPVHREVHDQSDVTEELQQLELNSSGKQQDLTKSTKSTKPAVAKAPEKKTSSSTTAPFSKAATRPSSAPSATGSRVESDGPVRAAKRPATEEGEGSDSTSGGAAHTRPSVRASRSKLTIPQPFHLATEKRHLATEKRASSGGRPVDAVAPKPRTTSSLLRKSHPAAASSTKTVAASPGGIRAAPTEISKEDQEALDTLEKDREAKLEEEIAALRIKSGNPSGFSFKSDERAEKRREFYSKLEEKMKAKEEEKNQIQAKSQEELENKMKQLRKSLTFKATPLPSFYQESGPPKVEVKKIPPTRPKSPRLTTSRRSSLVGDQDGSKSPVARIRNELRASGLGLHKSVDLTADKKLSVRKSVTSLPSMETKGAIRPKVNGDAAGKPKPVSVMPSPRKPSTGSVTESRTNRVEGQPESRLTASYNGGKSVNPRRALLNGVPSTDLLRSAEEGRTRSGLKSSESATPKAGDSKDGVRKSTQWRSKTDGSTPGSTPKRDTADSAERARSVNSTPIKKPGTPRRDLTPRRDVTPKRDLIPRRDLTPKRELTPRRSGYVEAESEPVKTVIATPSNNGGLTPVVPDVAVA